MGTTSGRAEPTDHPWLLPSRTIDDLVRARAAATPDAPALLDGHGRRLTFRMLDEGVDRAVGALLRAGISPGMSVAWQLPTRVSTVLTLFALRRLGAVQAPIVPLYRERELCTALTATRAEVLLIPGVWNGFDYRALVSRLELPDPVRVLEIGDEAPDAGEADALLPSPDPEQHAFTYFTSGSTGRPKGARHHDTALLTCGRGFAGYGRLGETPGEVGAMGFPVAHVGGVQYLIAALSAGFPLLLLETFQPDEAMRHFRTQRVTTTGGAPPFYSALLAAQRSATTRTGSRDLLLPDLRTLKGGGAPCGAELAKAVRSELCAVLAHDYGMTEIPMIAVGRTDDPVEVLDETDGFVLPSHEVRTMDSGGSPTAIGEPGEIQVRGPAVCIGYVDEADTAAAFTEDGWFRTGDLGRLDGSGRIEVVGRVKEMIIRKGENIAPFEIEELLAQHPSIVEAAVIGVPDADRGELVCAVIVVTAGTTAPDVASLGDWLTSHGLMHQKRPERVETIDALPRTGLFKVSKSELRARFETRHAGAASQ